MEHLAWVVRTVLPISLFSFLPTRRVEGFQQLPIVLIGCDTGMGHQTTLRLIKELGHARVYVGCFTAEGEESFKRDDKVITTFRIDVRDVNSVNAAAAFVKGREPDGVFAAVNVAGAMMGGPIEWTSMNVFRAEVELNYFGLIHVAKAFVPLLRTFAQRSKVRTRFVVVTSTIAVMPSFPGLSGYAASKSAADTFTNTLRLEVKPFDIDVITVCPGITRTPFLNQGVEQMRRAWKDAPDEIKQQYGEEYASWWANTMQLGINWLAHDPSDAVECLLDATTSAWPKTRYFCGLDARVIARPIVNSPDFIWDGLLGTLLFLGGQPKVKSRL